MGSYQKSIQHGWVVLNARLAVIKAPLATVRAPLRVSSFHLFVCLCVCRRNVYTKTRIFQKLNNLGLWSLLTTNRKFYRGFKKNIVEPLKLKMADIRHFQNCQIAIISTKTTRFWSNLVHNSRFGTRWQSRDQIWKFLELKMAAVCHIENSFWP